MAEGDEGGWWGSWYTTAKNKSAEVLEFVKRDLDEFSSAVKCEASNVVHSTSTVFKDKLKLDEPDSTASTVKRSVSSFFGQVSQVLNPSPDDDDQEVLVITESEPVQLSKFQIRLHELILKPETFLEEPDETQTLQYRAWREIVEDQFSIERLTKLLTASPELHKQYTTLVPDQVSHLVFWERYLFRKALLEDEEAQREALRRRAEREKEVAENYQWAQDEAFGGNLELSEEEQTRLLLEYQQECETKRIAAEKQSTDKPDQSSDSKPDSAVITDKNTDISSNMDDNHYASNKDKTVIANTTETKQTADQLVSGEESEVKGHSNTSSLGESIGEDWEREFDLSDAEMVDQQTSNDTNATNIPK